MKKSFFALTFLSLVVPFSGEAQFRKYSNEFLNIGAGARGLAMGNAQVATANDATAGYWNPAGLTGVKDNPNAGIMHAEYFAGIAKYDYASLAIPVQNNKRTLGFSLLRFAVDDIPNTLFLVEPDGSINYNNVQTFSSADYAFLFSFAQNLKETKNKRISFGANAKVIYRKVGKFASALGFGMDAGVQMHGNQWRLGLVARDITTTFNAWTFNFTEKEKEVLKTAIKHVAHKNIKMIPYWKEQNPSYYNDEGHINDKYMQIVMKSMGGSDKKEDETFEDKIIKNLAKTVLIEK
jgi:hypothetical protein